MYFNGDLTVGDLNSELVRYYNGLWTQFKNSVFKALALTVREIQDIVKFGATIWITDLSSIQIPTVFQIPTVLQIRSKCGRGSLTLPCLVRGKADFGVSTVGECPIGEYTRCPQNKAFSQPTHQLVFCFHIYIIILCFFIIKIAFIHGQLLRCSTARGLVLSCP